MQQMGTPQRKRRQYRSGSVTQRKDGLWIGRFEAGTDRNGKRRRIQVSATTEARCKEKLEARKAEVARTGVPDKLTGKAVTVEQWSKEWLALVVNEQRPKAYATTASAVKQWVVPTIGRKRLVALTPGDIRAVVDAQRKAGRANSTRVRTHSVMMSMLKAAMLEGHDVPQRVLLVKKPEINETDREAVALDHALLMLKAAVDDPTIDASRWTAAFLNGLRQGERLGLTWDLVDFEADLIDISWQLQPLPYVDNADKSLGFRVPDGYVARPLWRSFHLVRPKSAKSRRVIPMVKWLRDALLAWREVAPHSEHGLVWPRPDGRPVSAADDRAEWAALQEAAGVAHPAGRPYVQHEARHTTATLLLELGVPRDVIEAILGQAKLVEAYDHANRLPAARRALERVAERLTLSEGAPVVVAGTLALPDGASPTAS